VFSGTAVGYFDDNRIKNYFIEFVYFNELQNTGISNWWDGGAQKA